MVAGYAHPDYARSLSQWGRPRELPKCGGWVLERDIPGTPYKDAMGCYPLFVCQDWSRLHEDLDDLGDDLVSLALVADPLGQYDVAQLEASFDLVLAFKEHYIADLSRPLEEFTSRTHRKNARRALRNLTVEIVEDPRTVLDEWSDLYGNLVLRHGITGIRAFSEDSFAVQFQVPGLVAACARRQDHPVAVDLVYVTEDRAYWHLVACSDEGYSLGAAYATKWALLNYFSGRVRWHELGGVPGALDTEATIGLAHFKSGWSSGTRHAYFCGRVLNRQVYDHLSHSARPEVDYFPTYRAGEFG